MPNEDQKDTQPDLKAVGVAAAKFLDKLSDKQKKYLIIGLAILAVVLFVSALIIYFVTGNKEVSGGVGAGAAAAAAAAFRGRSGSREVVAEAKADTEAASASIIETHDGATLEMDAIEDAVNAASDEKLEEEGENLFGGNS